MWFTGLSGAGKTTVSRIVGAQMEARGLTVEYLDGDVVRTHLSRGLGFSREDRDINIERIGWVASRLTRAGACVIVSAISPYVATRAKARDMIHARAVRCFSHKNSKRGATSSRLTRKRIMFDSYTVGSASLGMITGCPTPSRVANTLETSKSSSCNPKVSHSPLVTRARLASMTSTDPSLVNAVCPTSSVPAPMSLAGL